MPSSIEWTDETWNPVTGCDKVSTGCRNCYAERITRRFRRAFPNGFAVTLREDRLEVPLRWRRPRRVFVNSMSDLFHEDVPDEFVARVFWTMARTPTHTYQILTKRPARMRDWIRGARARRILGPAGPLPVPLPNVWIGTSIENQRELERRLEPLLETPAAIRFLSCEPLLGPLDFEERPVDPLSTMGPWSRLELGIGWVIVGGESGPGARSMAPEWARGIRDQALAAGIPFFFKQWGGPRKAAAGRELDGRVWEEFPE